MISACILNSTNSTVVSFCRQEKNEHEFFAKGLLPLTVGFWADVKNGFTWNNFIVLKVGGGQGE